MLTETEIQAIREELKLHDDPRGTIPEALKIVQHHRGWVSDEALADLSAFLGIGVDDIDSVATFYSLIYRRHVGRHVILLCDSVSCHLTGYDGLRKHLEEKLAIRIGQTTTDGRFTLLPVVCLGACEQAPAMMVDSDLHGNLTAQKVDQVLEMYK